MNDLDIPKSTSEERAKRMKRFKTSGGEEMMSAENGTGMVI
jgi:hypothetical protein